jgi:hypothetical protein
MIRVNKNETFPLLVALLDESTGQNVSGETVYYEVRDIYDNVLTPSVSGTLSESTVEPGIYKTALTLTQGGNFVAYATCSGFATSTEEIIVNEDNIYHLVRDTHHYNISVEDVPRLNATPTTSQIARNVPLNSTDYVITRIKGNEDLDWSGTTTSGVVYAHYRAVTDTVPYKMGGPL